MDNANVDKALEKGWKKSNGDLDEIIYITQSQMWTPPKNGYADVFLVGAGGSGDDGGAAPTGTNNGASGSSGSGGGGGYTFYLESFNLDIATPLQVVIGAGSVYADGGVTKFLNFVTKGGNRASSNAYPGDGNSGGAPYIYGKATNSSNINGFNGIPKNKGGTFGGDGHSNNIYINAGKGLASRLDLTKEYSTLGYCPLDGKIYGSGGDSGASGGSGGIYTYDADHGGNGGASGTGEKGGIGATSGTPAGNGVNGSGGGGGLKYSSNTALNRNAGNGGNAAPPSLPLNYGDGGNGGNGGGGGGIGAITGSGSPQYGLPGLGSAGTPGRQGVVIIRYHSY